MTSWQLQFRLHAVQRMYQRQITPQDIHVVMEQGAVIEEYPEDTPYPSCLMLGYVRGRPLHVVIAKDEAHQRAVIVTVYAPDPLLWASDFRRRKTP